MMRASLGSALAEKLTGVRSGAWRASVASAPRASLCGRVLARGRTAL